MGHNKQAKGFSLLEVVVATSLLILVFTGVMSLVTLSRESSVANKNQLIGAYLAQEGMELVRYVRDDNYINQASPFTSLSSGTDGVDYNFIIDYQGFASIQSAASSDVRESSSLNLENGFYTYGSGDSAIETVFKRLVTTTHHDAAGPNPAYIDVEVEVYWEFDNKEKTYTVNGELIDWR